MTSKLKKISDKRRALSIAIACIVVLVAVIGIIVWQRSSADKKQTSGAQASTLSQKEQNEKDRSECEKKNDKDICRFVANWKMESGYRLTAAIEGRGTYTYTVDDTNTSTKVEGSTPYEVVTMGDTIYTKAGGVWYKQTIKGAGQQVSQGINNSLSQLNLTSGVSQADLVAKYKLIGKEACGDLTCFKYEASRDEGKETIWFDDAEYKARKVLAKTADSTTEATFDYANTTVTAPSPARELGPNEYLEPGGTTPKRMPAAN